MSATSARIFRFLWLMPLLGFRSPLGRVPFVRNTIKQIINNLYCFFLNIVHIHICNVRQHTWLVLEVKLIQVFNLQNVRYTCNLPWHTWLVLDMDHGEKDYGKPSNFVFHYKCALAQLLRFSTNILYLLGTSHLFFRSEFSKDLIFWLWLTVCTLLVFKRAPEFSMNSDWKRKWHHNF